MQGAYHLRENLVINNLLRKVFNHQGQTIQQAHTQCSVRIAKQAYDDRRQLGIEFICRQLAADLQCSAEDLWPTATKLDRLEKFRKDLHLEEVFRKVIGQVIKFTGNKRSVAEVKE